MAAVFAATVAAPVLAEEEYPPEGFVYVGEAAPGVVVDARYFGENNFVGARIDGYLAPRAILSEPAARALRAANESLAAQGLGLKVFDAYRPQQAVDHFVRWAADLSDKKTKAEYYPRVPKNELFARGYIAEKSGHTRGGTVDLTIVRLSGGGELDMGSPFDFFGEESAVDYPNITPEQRRNRGLLQKTMRAHGFKPYPQEWWHFTLRNEPHPNTYFNFPIR